jgi:uncharacterized membrane protein
MPHTLYGFRKGAYARLDEDRPAIPAREDASIHHSGSHSFDSLQDEDSEDRIGLEAIQSYSSDAPILEAESSASFGVEEELLLLSSQDREKMKVKKGQDGGAIPGSRQPRVLLSATRSSSNSSLDDAAAARSVQQVVPMLDDSGSMAPAAGTDPTPAAGPWRRMYARAFHFLSCGGVFTLGLFLAALSTLFFAILNLCVKVLSTPSISHVPPVPSFHLVGWRSLFTIPLSIAASYALGVSDPVLGPRALRKWLLLRGITGFLAVSSLYLAISLMPLGDAVALSFTNPIFTAIFARIFLGEPWTWIDAAAAVTSLGGVFMLSRPSFLFPTAPAGGGGAGWNSSDDPSSGSLFPPLSSNETWDLPVDPGALASFLDIPAVYDPIGAFF